MGRQTPDEPFRNAIFPAVLLGSERVYRSSLIVWSDSMRDAMDLDADLAERLCVFISPRDWQNGALGAIQSSKPSAVGYVNGIESSTSSADAILVRGDERSGKTGHSSAFGATFTVAADTRVSLSRGSPIAISF